MSTNHGPRDIHRSWPGLIRRTLEHQPWWAPSLLEVANIVNRPWLSALAWIGVTGLAVLRAPHRKGPEAHRNLPAKSPGSRPDSRRNWRQAKDFPISTRPGPSGSTVRNEWGGDFGDGVSHRLLASAPDLDPRLNGENTEVGRTLDVPPGEVGSQPPAEPGGAPIFLPFTGAAELALPR